MLHGRCCCGAVAFEVPDRPVFSTVCHCGDCRRQSGAPFLAWAMFRAGDLETRGRPAVYASSEDGRRSFCAGCGTGLFFTNAALDRMGMVQVRVAALDRPEAIAPQLQVQAAERLGWVERLGDLPAVPRFPG